MRIWLVTAHFLVGCSLPDPEKLAEGLDPYLDCAPKYLGLCDVRVRASSRMKDASCQRLFLTGAVQNLFLTYEMDNEDPCPPCPSEEDRLITCAYPTEEHRVAVWIPRRDVLPTANLPDVAMKTEEEMMDAAVMLDQGVEVETEPKISGNCPLTCE